MKIIKTRFAPSPTGYLHLGNIRTALYSWIYAKKNNGIFLLRIDDTNEKKYSSSQIRHIIDTMEWLNLTWDEGPYLQTHRLKRYLEIINNMLIKGTAYKCYCSKKRLEDLRNQQLLNNKKPKYDGHCRSLMNNNIKLNQEIYEKNLIYSNFNKSYCIRFKNPQNGYVTFKDKIRGKIKFNNKELDDLIILRKNGIPTYNFSGAIDDWDMKITHVIRGEEHINNTPRQINILKSLKAKIPKYAHVSTILDENKKKLSKRNNSIHVLSYKEEGILPEAILNHLLRLGWSYGNQEIFSLYEMKKLFNLHSINKSSSIFIKKKLLWFNNHYINHLENEKIAKYLIRYIKDYKLNINYKKYKLLLRTIITTKKHSKTLIDIINYYKLLFFNKEKIDFFKISQTMNINILNTKMLILIKTKLTEINDWNQTTISEIIKQISIEYKFEVKKIYKLLRLIITKKEKKLPILLIMTIIGKYKVIYLLNHAIQFINENNN